MLNISDKDLDRLSREAAEYYEPEDIGLSWKKLEQELGGEINDKPPASPPFYKRGPIIIGSVILLLTGVSYFLIKSIRTGNNSTQKQISTTVTPSKQENNKQAEAAKTNQPPSNDELKNSSDNNSQHAGVNNDKSASTAGSVNASGNAANKSTAQAISSYNANATNNNRNNQANIEKNNRNRKGGYAVSSLLIAGKSKNPVTKNNGNKIKSAQSNNINQQEGIDQDNSNISSNKSAQNSGILNRDTKEESLQYAILPGLELYNDHYPAVSDASLRKFTIANTPTQNDAQKNKQSLHINRALKIGVMYAPDYTNVPSGPSNGTSNNVGITIGYEFVDRWSVNSGLIYTRKNYGANGGDFHAVPPGASYGSHLEYVKGNCDMWEIPLSLRYDFAKAGKNTFFATAGLSSYVMKKEEYTYYWHRDNSSNPWYPQSWTTGPYSFANKDLYLLSIASLSAGMEHQFGKGFSLQVEPFIKIPLIGVGLGSLQMNSYGVSFSFRYAPVLNKTRH